MSLPQSALAPSFSEEIGRYSGSGHPQGCPFFFFAFPSIVPAVQCFLLIEPS
jgi:hypothetical protein